jgi:urease accessory protein
MRATAVKPVSTWSGAAADRVVLSHDERHCRRTALTGSNGLAFLLDLPAATRLRNGDALTLEDGRLIEVVAACEEIFEIRCNDVHHLARLAWHLGNRHVPVQVLTEALRIRRDHVLAELATQLGAEVVPLEAPFEPEPGAYDGAHTHGDTHHET